jgi:VWFA-related protein
MSRNSSRRPLAHPSAPPPGRRLASSGSQATVAASVCLVLSLFGATLHPAVGQAAVFEEGVRVFEVQVPVNVTGRDGEPLRGLGAEDFQVYDRGRKQELTGLRVVDLETLAPSEGPDPWLELPSAARRHFLLFFDLAFSSPTAVLRARQAARSFVLEALHPADLVGVMTFSLEQGPRLLVTFTRDRAQVARAIDTLGADPLLDPTRKQDPLRFVVDTPDTARAFAAAPTGREDFQGLMGVARESELLAHLRHLGRGFDRMERSFAASRIQAWSRSLGEIARALDSVPGRKQIIYLSEGFDSRLLVGRDSALEEERSMRDDLNILRGQAWTVDSDERFGDTGLQREVFAMLEQFRRADCVIQVVDIGGLRADQSTRDFTRALGHDSLFYLANETGGELYKDANELHDQLVRVLDRSSVTYVLSFEPQDLPWDGSYRPLRVRVNAPRGTQVAHRTGYFAPRPFQELDPIERQLLASGAIAAAEARQELDLELLVAPFRAGAAAAYVPLIVEVGGERLLEGHDEEALELEIFAYVTDQRGEVRDFLAQQISLDLSRGREAIRQTGVKYYGHLELAPGEYLVRLLARNTATGRAGLLVRPLEVPHWARDEPALLPPFFVEPPGRWVLVRAQDQDQRGMVVYPFVVDGDPFIPAARPPLRSRGRAALCLMAYNLGPGDITVEMVVLGPEGSPVDGGRLTDLERTVTGIEGLDRFVATFEPRGLSPGGYTLQLAATDPATGLTRVSSAPFIVIR